MTRASEDELGALHAVVAEYLAGKIRDGEASASDIANAIKFLKDNSITAVVDEGSALGELEKQLGRTPSPVSGADLEQALKDLEWNQAQVN